MKKKRVLFHKDALKEYQNLDKDVQKRFLSRFEVLEKTGRLEEPEGKKMAGYTNLFEMRVRCDGQWRGFYGYEKDNVIFVVHFTGKKTQKTEKNTIKLVIKRLKHYERENNKTK